MANDGTTCHYADPGGSTYGDDTYGLCTRTARRACARGNSPVTAAVAVGTVIVEPPLTTVPDAGPCGDFDEGCN